MSSVAVGAVATTRAPSQPAPTPRLGPTPEVTPWVECGTRQTLPPVVQLQVNGQPIDGFVEVIASDTEPSPPIEDLPGPAQVPVDVISELWIEGGACATSWDVGLFGGETLDRLVNPSLDPAIAAQNRFKLFLAPYAGRDALLRADLFFPDLAIRAVWRIAVGPFERPAAFLQGEGDPLVPVEGCDVQLVLGNGYEYPSEGCTGDLPFEPSGTLALERGSPLVFGFLGGWDVQNAVLTCGRLSGTTFVAEPEPGCFFEASPFDEEPFVTFPELPRDLEAGVWVVAISACATSGSLGANHVCGSWYAKVDVGA